MHLGLFAYASGASQEWRLSASMNAIASHLDPRSIRSVTMLVSPTTVPTRQPESAAAAEQLRAHEPVWKSALAGAGLLPRPGHVAANGVKIGLSTVSIQGLSYQAAQYLSKLAAAESFAVYGPTWQDGVAQPIRVSSNVAGITRALSSPALSLFGRVHRCASLRCAHLRPRHHACAERFADPARPAQRCGAR